MNMHEIRAAALDAAAGLVGRFLRSSSSPRLSAAEAQRWTIGTADTFADWIQTGEVEPSTTQEPTP